MSTLTSQAADLLEQWLASRLTAEQSDWFETQIKKIAQSNSDRELHITLGLIPRKFSRDDLSPTAIEITAANTLLKGWNPSGWSIDLTARIALLCRVAEQRGSQFNDTIIDLCKMSDLAESIALYSGFCLYPHSESLDQQISEGLRTNIRSVFEAIAHNNPYPALHFDQHRWNHMVLKALFIESQLAPIYGLDSRKNPELAGILCDYAHERWAAGRPVTPELWRCVGPFATGSMIDDLERASQSDNTPEQNSALIALTQTMSQTAGKTMDQTSNKTDEQRAADIVAGHPDVARQIASGTLTWDSIQQQLTDTSV